MDDWVRPWVSRTPSAARRSEVRSRDLRVSVAAEKRRDTRISSDEKDVRPRRPRKPYVRLRLLPVNDSGIPPTGPRVARVARGDGGSKSDSDRPPGVAAQVQLVLMPGSIPSVSPWIELGSEHLRVILVLSTGCCDGQCDLKDDRRLNSSVGTRLDAGGETEPGLVTRFDRREMHGRIGMLKQRGANVSIDSKVLDTHVIDLRLVDDGVVKEVKEIDRLGFGHRTSRPLTVAKCLPDCSAPGFLDSGLTVFASTLPRPARRGHVAPERDFDSGISPASTARCTFA